VCVCVSAGSPMQPSAPFQGVGVRVNISWKGAEGCMS